MANRNLLIVGAGIYALVAKEIAESMQIFEKIAFVDDKSKETPNGIPTVGTCADIQKLSAEYGNIIVAIGNPGIRMSILRKIEEETPCKIVTLVSPYAYVSPSAQILKGSIIEPMAVVHTGAIVSAGCIISAGAVINHASMCCDGVHIDCNATVGGNTVVPAGTKVQSGEVYDRKTIGSKNLFHPHTPTTIDGKTYNFDDVM